MKKVLYIGPLYDGTGYAHMANNTILTLDHAGYDVIARSVKLTGQVVPPPLRVQELERKALPDNIDVTVQHMLPPLMTWNKRGGKNIGYFHCETDNFGASGWQHYLNLMDEVWVCCPQNVQAAQSSGVKVPIRLVSGANWPTTHLKSTKLAAQLNIPKNTTVFYTIGDYSERKGIRELIRYFLRTFVNSPHQVTLILKTYVDGKAPEESLQIVQRDIEAIKAGLRMSANNLYPKIIVIPSSIPEEMIQELHDIGDVFVTLEKGAAWNIPAIEAYNRGNWVVCVQNVPPDHVLPNHSKCHVLRLSSKSTGLEVNGMSNCTYPGLYTGNETWYGVPDHSHEIESVLRWLGKIVLENGKEKHTNRILHPDEVAAQIKGVVQ